MVRSELTHALKDLMRRPRFSLTVVMTLAVVVGSGGALFSLLNAFVLRTLPVREPGGLVLVYSGVGEALYGVPGTMLTALREQRDTFESLCGIARSAYAVDTDGVLTMHPAELMSSECASTLGVSPFMGRLIDESDNANTSAAAPVVVISHEFWRRALSADPNVIGRTLHLDGHTLTIIGVMPADFTGLNVEQSTALTVPLGLLNLLLSGKPGGPVLAMHAVGRLMPGVTLEQAEVRLRSRWTTLWDAATVTVAGGQRPSPARDVSSLRVESFATGLSVYRVRYQQPLQVLVGLAVTLIVLSSINVANLFLVRTDARAHEIAVQLALGAGHARVGVRLVGEALLLAGVGAMLAIPVAWWLSSAIAQMLWTSIYPMTARVTPDGAVVAAMVGVALGTGMVLAAPSLVAARFRIGHLRAGDGRSVFSTTGRWRRALIAAQVASATVLLFSSGLFLRSLMSLHRLDPGYPTEGLAWSALQRVPRASGIDRDYALEMIRRVSEVSGVRSAAMSTTFPTFDLRQLVSQTPLRSAPEAPEIAGYADRVSPAFFETTGIALLRGREFDWQDDAGKPRVAIVNTVLAERLFPGRDPTGQRILVGPQLSEVTVVGVAKTVSPGDQRASTLPIVYQPLLQSPPVTARLLVRSNDRAGLLADLDRAMRPLGRHYLVVLRTMEEQFDIFFARERVLTLLSTVFAGIGVMVGGGGIYAVLAHAVSRRTRELGVRLAIGASPARLVVMVLGEAGWLLIGGLAIGVPLAILSGRLAGSLLFEAPPFDMAVLVAVVSGLAVVIGVASLLPARRAACLDPSQALRHE
jgi:predicted permease